MEWLPTRVLAWRIPWTEKPASYGTWCRKELDTTDRLTLSFSYAAEEKNQQHTNNNVKEDDKDRDSKIQNATTRQQHFSGKVEE